VGAKAEQLFISSILRQEDHVTPLTNGVTKNWFSHYQDQWEWIARYIDRHRSCPSKTLFKSKFSNFQILKVDDVEFTTAELRDAFISKSLVRKVDQALDSIEEQKNPQRVLEELQKSLIDLHGEASTTSNESDVVEDWESVFNEVSRRSEKANERGMAGLPTGFQTLDLATNGPQPGDFFVVAARLGQGKTWTLIRMAASALMAGATVQYDALEQSKSQIAMRVHTFLQSENAKQMFTTSELMSGKGVDLIAYKKFLKKLKDDLPGKLIVDDTSRGKVTPASIAAQL
jgi:replicative DNA helicase